MKPKISILGCGWLGTPLGHELAKNGYIIQGSTRSCDKFEFLESNEIKPFLVDIDELNRSILRFLDTTILIIAITSKNIEQFKKLINLINECSIEKIIFISSTSVYYNNCTTITEGDKTNNSVLNQIEDLFIHSSKFETTVLRFGGLFGYNRKPGNFIKPPKKLKNPEGYINLIHQDDCIQIIKEIISKNVWGEIFNACSSNHPKRDAFYSKEVLRIQDRVLEIEENSLNEYKIVSSNKLKRVLNYQFKFDDLMNLKE